MRRVLGLVVVAVLAADLIAAAAVSRSATPAAGAHVAPPSTTTRPRVPIGTFPLTGLTAYQGDHPERPPVSVKVDDAPDAYPQAGLDAADVVTEELVEGGLTRLLATFQSRDAGSVGPVRSARPEDAALVQELGGSLAFSGASAGVLATLGTVPQIQPLAGDGIFTRDRARAAPANLFLDTTAVRRLGLGPQPLFGFTPTAQGTIAPSVALRFSGSSVAGWRWNPTTNQYDRAEHGRPDLLADGEVVHAANVVILSVAVRGSTNYDVRHNQTPVEQVVGDGPAWVLRDGVLIAGHWTRPSVDQPLQIGTGLRAGPTWIELLPRPFLPAFAG